MAFTPSAAFLVWHWRRALPALTGLLAFAALGVAADPKRETPATRDRAADREPALQLSKLGVSPWHSAGCRGKGVKVAVLDSGFRGWREFLGKALPPRVTARSFRRDGNLEAKDSQHGILCGEVVHALAPDAELLFANWEPDEPGQFLEAVRWARRQGAQVFTCSVIMPSWSDGEGGGWVHDALGRILGPGRLRQDSLYFACAGNTAQRHWSGPFCRGSGGFHAWERGQVENELNPWGDGEPVSVELCCPPGVRYEVSVTDRASDGRVETRTGRNSADRPCAMVRFPPKEGHTYRVRVRQVGDAAGPFHLVALGAGMNYATQRGSVPFPADGPEVIAIGAVDADGRRMPYSSCGPNSSRPKPDFVAPVPFTSKCRSWPFGGTSAAAPQAAALAALLWSEHPDWTSDQVRTSLQRSALDLGPPGHDFETGYGLVRLPPAPAGSARAARTGKAGGTN
jgi:hypothetical protein